MNLVYIKGDIENYWRKDRLFKKWRWNNWRIIWKILSWIIIYFFY